MLCANRLRPRLVSFLALFLLAGTACPLSAQVKFELRGEGAAAGELVQAGLNQDIKVDVYIVNPAGPGVASIQGFQLAVSHDPAFLDFLGATWKGTALDAAALRASAGPEQFLPRKLTTGTPGMTLGVIFENGQTTPPSFFLGAGEWKVAVLTYKPLKLTPEGVPSHIDFAPELGNPPIANKYSDHAKEGQTFAPASTVGASVEIGTEPVYTVNFEAPKVTVDTGAQVVAPVLIQNGPKSVHGFSFGVKHDGASLDLVDVTIGAGLRDVLGTMPNDESFHVIDKAPAGGPGFTVAMVLSAGDKTKTLAPAKSPHRVIDATYKVKLTTGTTDIQVSGDLGQPKVEVILDLFGVAQRPNPPATNPPPTALTIEVKPLVEETRFIRGDVDQNRKINITDAIGVLRYLFDLGNLLEAFKPTAEKCLIAFNVDGSAKAAQVEEEGDIDLTDAIYLLGYQFLGGPVPPAPFGSDGTACASFTGKSSDRMKCVEFACQ